MFRFWKTKPVDPDPPGPIVDICSIRPDWKRRLAAKVSRIDTWLLYNLPTLRWAMGPRGRRKIRRLFVRRRDFSDLKITFDVDPFMTFVAPRPWQLATGYLPHSGDEMCRIGFGVSPLDNEIFVDDLEVHPSLRRRGLARLMLKVAVERCSPPGKPLRIVPLQESVDSLGFWNAINDDHDPYLCIDFSMRRCEMQKASEYWADLAQCSDALSRYARDRKVDIGAMEDPSVDGRRYGYRENMKFIGWLGRLLTERARDR